MSDVQDPSQQPPKLGVERRNVLLSVAGMVLTAGAAAACSSAPTRTAVRRNATERSSAPSLLVNGDTHPVQTRPVAYSTNSDQPEYYVHKGPKAIALTIDDGPDPRFTPQVLKILHHYGIHATFCMIGTSVQAHPALVRDVIAHGHQVANHTWTHPDLVNLSHASILSQIERTSAALHHATRGTYKPTIFRAPYGAWSRDTLAICRQLKLRPLDWSVDPRDWSRPGVPAIVDNVLHNTRTGSIILEHDGGGDRSQTVAALKIFLPRLLDKGYHFVMP